jgi:hypothetical protein
LRCPPCPASRVAGRRDLLLDLCINDRCVGVAPVIARGDDVLIDRQALEVAGIDTRDVIPSTSANATSSPSASSTTAASSRSTARCCAWTCTLRADRLPRQTASLTERTAKHRRAPQPGPRS